MAQMTADETLRFLEAHCWSMRKFESSPAASGYGVEILDPIQGRRRFVFGPTIRAAAEKAEEILEVHSGNQENNETEAAN